MPQLIWSRGVEPCGRHQRPLIHDKEVFSWAPAMDILMSSSCGAAPAMAGSATVPRSRLATSCSSSGLASTVRSRSFEMRRERAASHAMFVQGLIQCANRFARVRVAIAGIEWRASVADRFQGSSRGLVPAPCTQPQRLQVSCLSWSTACRAAPCLATRLACVPRSPSGPQRRRSR